MVIELSFTVVLTVALGGAAGTVMRFLLDLYVPAGILLSNVIGSLILGIMTGLSAGDAVNWNSAVLGLASVGFAGSLSTFATVSLRAAQLWASGRTGRATGLWLMHLCLGLTAAALGAWCGWLIAG